jgi:hypothetical protein
MSAHFLVWPGCMNIQAEQPAAGAISLARPVPARRMSLFPGLCSRPRVGRRHVGLGGLAKRVN